MNTRHEQTLAKQDAEIRLFATAREIVDLLVRACGGHQKSSTPVHSVEINTDLSRENDERSL